MCTEPVVTVATRFSGVRFVVHYQVKAGTPPHHSFQLVVIKYPASTERHTVHEIHSETVNDEYSFATQFAVKIFVHYLRRDRQLSRGHMPSKLELSVSLVRVSFFLYVNCQLFHISVYRQIHRHAFAINTVVEILGETLRCLYLGFEQLLPRSRPVFLEHCQRFFLVLSFSALHQLVQTHRIVLTVYRTDRTDYV